jgi:hypothetical protein
MKFGYACTFAGKPRCETPAPPFKKRKKRFKSFCFAKPEQKLGWIERRL